MGVVKEIVVKEIVVKEMATNTEGGLTGSKTGSNTPS